MKLFIYKLFFKSKMIRYYMFYPDGRMKIGYAIPEDNQFHHEGGRYDLGDRDGFISKGILTYVYQYDRIDPINPLDLNKSIYPAKYYDTAINANVIKEVFNATSGETIPKTLLITLGAIVITGVLVWYMIDMQLQEIRTILEPISNIGGGQ